MLNFFKKYKILDTDSELNLEIKFKDKRKNILITLIFLLFNFFSPLLFEIFIKLKYYPEDDYLNEKDIDSKISFFKIFVYLILPLISLILTFFFVKKKIFIKKGYLSAFLFNFYSIFISIFYGIFDKINDLNFFSFFLFFITFFLFKSLLIFSFFFLFKNSDFLKRKIITPILKLRYRDIFVWLIISILLFFFLYSIFYYLINILNLKENKSLNQNILEKKKSTIFLQLFSTFLIIFWGSFIEEIIFRFGIFNIVSGKILPIVVSTLIFSLFHFSFNINLFTVFHYTFFSFFFSLIYSLTKRNILFSIFLHIIFNFVLFFFFIL
jgi:membrane protease YdiL (CAAX protease family)